MDVDFMMFAEHVSPCVSYTHIYVGKVNSNLMKMARPLVQIYKFIN